MRLALSHAQAPSGGLTAAKVHKSLARLERLGIVAETTHRQRGRVFRYRRYVNELAVEVESAP